MKFYLIFSIFLIGFFVPIYFGIQEMGGIYSSGYFENSIFKQIVTLVNFDTIKMILESSVEITGDKAESITGYEGLNKLYLGILLLGVSLFFFNYGKTIFNFLRLKKNQLGEAGTTVIYLTILMTTSLLVLAAFHVPFRVDGSDIIPDDEILPRYMIEMRIFLLYGFMYGLFILLTPAYRQLIPSTPKNKENYKNENLFLSEGKINVQNQSTKNFKTETTNKVVWKNERKIFSMIFVMFVIILFAYYMWDSAIRFYENYAAQIAVYYDTAQWISSNLDNNEMAFLPMEQIFWSINPALKDKTYTYDFTLESRGYVVRPDSTDAEFLEVNRYLKEFVNDDINNVKYLVFDWVDKNGKFVTGIEADDLINPGVCQKFDQTLIEIQRFNFRLPHSNWGNSMVVCELRNQ